MASLIPSIPLGPINDPNLKPTDLLLIPKPLYVRKSGKGPGSPYSFTTGHTRKFGDKEDSSWPPYLLLRDVQWIMDEVDKTILDYVSLAVSETNAGDTPVMSPFLVRFRPQPLMGSTGERGIYTNDIRTTQPTRSRKPEHSLRKRSSRIGTDSHEGIGSGQHSRITHEQEVLGWLGKRSPDHAKDRKSSNQSFRSAQLAEDTRPKREFNTQEEKESSSGKPRDKTGGKRQASRVGSETGFENKDASNRHDLSRSESSRKKRRSSLRKEVLMRDSGLFSAEDESSSKDSAISTRRRSRAVSFRHHKAEEEPAHLTRSSSSRSAGESAALAERSYTNWFFR